MLNQGLNDLALFLTTIKMSQLATDKDLRTFLEANHSAVTPSIKGYRKQLYDKFKQEHPSATLSWNHFTYILRQYIDVHNIPATECTERVRFNAWMDDHKYEIKEILERNERPFSWIKQKYDHPEDLTNTRLYKWTNENLDNA